MLFFFFKQKTAYEMRISDWSSDVCSSDLLFMASLAPGGPAAYTTIGQPGFPSEVPGSASERDLSSLCLGKRIGELRIAIGSNQIDRSRHTRDAVSLHRFQFSRIHGIACVLSRERRWLVGHIFSFPVFRS